MHIVAKTVQNSTGSMGSRTLRRFSKETVSIPDGEATNNGTAATRNTVEMINTCLLYDIRITLLILSVTQRKRRRMEREVWLKKTKKKRRMDLVCVTFVKRQNTQSDTKGILLLI